MSKQDNAAGSTGTTGSRTAEERPVGKLKPLVLRPDSPLPAVPPYRSPILTGAAQPQVIQEWEKTYPNGHHGLIRETKESIAAEKAKEAQEAAEREGRRLVFANSAFRPEVKVPLAVAHDPKKFDTLYGRSATEGWLDDITLQLLAGDPNAAQRLESRIKETSFSGSFVDEYVRKPLAGIWRAQTEMVSVPVRRWKYGDEAAKDVITYGNPDAGGALGESAVAAARSMGVSAPVIEATTAAAEFLPGRLKFAAPLFGVAAGLGMNWWDPANRYAHDPRVIGAPAAQAYQQRQQENFALHPREVGVGNLVGSGRPSLSGTKEALGNTFGKGITWENRVSGVSQFAFPVYNLARRGIERLRGGQADWFDDVLDVGDAVNAGPSIFQGHGTFAPRPLKPQESVVSSGTRSNRQPPRRILAPGEKEIETFDLPMPDGTTLHVEITELVTIDMGSQDTGGVGSDNTYDTPMMASPTAYRPAPPVSPGNPGAGLKPFRTTRPRIFQGRFNLPHAVRGKDDNGLPQAGDIRYAGDELVAVREVLPDGNLKVETVARGAKRGAEVDANARQMSADEFGKLAATRPHAGDEAPFLLDVTDKDTLRLGFMQAFGVAQEHAVRQAEHADGIAQAWSKRSGRDVADWYRDNLPLLGSGDLNTARRLMYDNDVHAGMQQGLSRKQAMAQANARGAARDAEARQITGAFAPASVFTGDANDTRKVLTALSHPESHTGMHELGHIFLEQLKRESPAEAEKIALWATGGRSREIDALVHERFAKAYQHYDANGGELPGVTQRILGRFTRWLADVYDRLPSRGGINGAGVHRKFAFNPTTLDILARHHGTKPDVQRPVTAGAAAGRFNPYNPFRRTTAGTGTAASAPLPPLLARFLGIQADGTVQQPTLSPTLFQASQSDINGWVGDMKAGYDAVDRWRAGVTQPIVKQSDYVDGMFATKDGVFAKTTKAVDRRFPDLDMNRLAPYLDKNGNLVLKLIPGYDRQAVGWAKLLKAMNAMRVGGGARLGGIKKNLDHRIIGASRDPKPAQSAIDRAGYPAIMLPGGEVVDSDTPFLIVNGTGKQNLGNLEATKLAFLYFKHLVDMGRITETQANNLLKAALYVQFKKDVDAGKTIPWEGLHYAKLLEAADGDVTLDNWRKFAGVLDFDDVNGRPNNGRNLVMQRLFSEDNSNAFGFPFWRRFANSMSDERFNSPGSGYGSIITGVDQNGKLINTHEQDASFEKSLTYPHAFQGDIIGALSRAINVNQMPLHDAKTGGQWMVKRKKRYVPGKASDWEFRMAPPVIVIPKTMLSGLLKQPPKKGR